VTQVLSFIHSHKVKIILHVNSVTITDNIVVALHSVISLSKQPRHSLKVFSVV